VLEGWMTGIGQDTRGWRDRWFACPVRRPDAIARLFCLPYAGAGASAFRAWPAEFGPHIEVVAVQLPGRENRIGDSLVLDPAEIATAIAAKADRPFAIFGHSLGGRLGFEVARALRRAGAPQPVRLYPSGSRPPDAVADGPYDGLSRLGGNELIARVAAGGGIPDAVLAEPELVELILPVLRADLRWIDDYRYVPEPPLTMPLTVFAGEADGVAPAEQLAGWRRHTTAACTVHTLSGGHFFLHGQLGELARSIERDLLDVAAARAQ
jgi:surfactin synthase thioesterase subunit